MKKAKMILAGTTGAMGLAILAMALLTWNAFSSKTAAREGDPEEGTDGLETVVSRAQMLSRKEVYPCAESLKALEANRAVLVEWQHEAHALAIRGDRVYPAKTPATFKTFLVADAKRLASLPGTAQGALVKPGFAFGPFKDYITGGKMPNESELALFQRKWDDVATIVEILAQSGVSELTDIQFKDEKSQASEASAQGPKKRFADQRSKRRGAKAASPVLNSPQSFSYVVSFTAKPAALVKLLNAFSVCERFVAIDSLSFTRGIDALNEALGGPSKENAANRRSRRGRRETEASAKKQAETKRRIVTDPLLDAPLSVVLVASVCDFKSLEKGQEGKK